MLGGMRSHPHIAPMNAALPDAPRGAPAADGGAAVAPLRLYADERSSASLRVLCALDFKGLPYTLQRVDLLAGEHRSEPHGRRNPAQAVPLLELADGRRLAQSLAICEYLEALWPQPALLPQAPYERARALALCQFVAADMHPLGNLRVRQEVARRCGDAAARDWVRHWAGVGLAALDAQLAPVAGAFAVGDAPSLVDVFVAPQAFNAERAGLSLAAWPQVERVYAGALALPALARLVRLREAWHAG